MSEVDTKDAALMSAAIDVISSSSALDIGGRANGERPFVASCLDELFSPSKERLTIIVSKAGVILMRASRYFTTVVRSAVLTFDFLPSFDIFFCAMRCQKRGNFWASSSSMWAMRRSLSYSDSHMPRNLSLSSLFVGVGCDSCLMSNCWSSWASVVVVVAVVGVAEVADVEVFVAVGCTCCVVCVGCGVKISGKCCRRRCCFHFSASAFTC